MDAPTFDRRSFVGIAALTGVGLLFAGRASGAARDQLAVNHTPEEWKKLLGPERYSILREASTEPPFTSPLLKEHRKGAFVCAGCQQPVFSSATKFESGTGWPSFWRALPGSVIEQTDHRLPVKRTEILCSRCGGHLGHVFYDGPQPSGLRYCINGLALMFQPA